MPYQSLTQRSGSGTGGYTSLTSGGGSSGGFVPSFAGVPPRQRPDDDHGILGFFSNLAEGGVNLVGGLGKLLIGGATDIGKAVLEPGFRMFGSEGFEYETPKALGALTGIDALAGRPTRSVIAQDFAHRYGPLLQGNLSEFGSRLYEDPLSFGLDVLGAGAVAGKGARALAVGAEVPGTAGRLTVGPSTRVAGALEELAAARAASAPLPRVSGLARVVETILPEQKFRLVGTEVQPIRTSLNPVRRLVWDRPFEALATTPLDELEQAVGLLRGIPEPYRLPAQQAELARLEQQVAAARAGGVTRIERPIVSNLRLRRVVDKVLGEHFHVAQARRDEAITAMAETMRPVIEEGLDDVAEAHFQRIAVEPGGAVQPAFIPETKVLDEAGAPRKVYHGTPQAYERPSLEAVQAKGDDLLYGRGHYFTEDPGVASGYAKGDFVNAVRYLPDESRAEIASRLRRELQDRYTPPGSPPGFHTMADFEYERGLRTINDFIHQGMTGGLLNLADQPYLLPVRRIAEEVADLGLAPNVRPAYLDIRNPFDMEAAITDELVEAVREHLLQFPGARRDFDAAWADNLESDVRAGRGMRGDTLWQSLKEAAEQTDDAATAAEAANQVLKEFGYDGITHTGGRIIGNREHRVWIAFRDDQVRGPWLEGTEAQLRAGEAAIRETQPARVGSYGEVFRGQPQAVQRALDAADEAAEPALYHTTDVSNLDAIGQQGLSVSDEGLFFADSPRNLTYAAPHRTENQAILRVRPEAVGDPSPGRYPGEWVGDRPVPAEAIDVLDQDGTWQPIARPAPTRTLEPDTGLQIERVAPEVPPEAAVAGRRGFQAAAPGQESVVAAARAAEEAPLSEAVQKIVGNHELERAADDVMNASAYRDAQGNYHLPEAGKRKGPIAPWNKAVKRAFPDRDFFQAAREWSERARPSEGWERSYPFRTGGRSEVLDTLADPSGYRVEVRRKTSGITAGSLGYSWKLLDPSGTEVAGKLVGIRSRESAMLAGEAALREALRRGPGGDELVIRGFHGTKRGADFLAPDAIRDYGGLFHMGTRNAADEAAGRAFLTDADVAAVEARGRFLGADDPLSELDNSVLQAGSLDEARNVDLILPEQVAELSPTLRSLIDEVGESGDLQQALRERGYAGYLYRNEVEDAGSISAALVDTSAVSRLPQAEVGASASASAAEIGLASRSASASIGEIPGSVSQTPPLNASISRPSGTRRSNSPLAFQYLGPEEDVSRFATDAPFHAHPTVESLDATAPVVAQELETALRATFGDDAVVTPRIKDAKRAQEKLDVKRAVFGPDHPGAQIGRIKDYVGSRVIVSNWSDAPAAIDKLRSVGEILEIDNGLTVPFDSGYIGINTTIRLPSGEVAEVQIHTPLSMRTANVGHVSYQSWRSMKAQQLKAIRDGEVLPEGFARQMDLTEAYMRRQFEPARREAEQMVMGREVSTLDQSMEALRLQVQETLTNPLIEKGLLSPAEAMERAYLPLRMQSGARYDYARGGFVGGLDTLELDRMLDARGISAPIYFPHIDVRRTNFRDFLAFSKSTIGARKAAERRYLRQSTGHLFEKGLYEKDAVASYSRRAAQAVRYEETFRFVETVADRFGRRISKIDELNPATEAVFAPDGLIRFFRMRMTFDDTAAAMLHAAESAEDTLAGALKAVLEPVQDELASTVLRDGVGVTRKGVELYAIPKAVAERLEAHARPLLSPGIERNLRLFADTPTNVWRGIVLSGSPRWVVNNILGNIAFLKMQGGSLVDVLRQFDSRWRAKIREIPGIREVEGGFFSENAQYLPRRGSANLTRTGELYEAIGAAKPVQRVRSIGQFMRRVNSEVEDAFRRASYLKAVDRVEVTRQSAAAGRSFYRGLDRLERIARRGADDATVARALDEVNYFFNDYRTATPLSRQVIRRFLVPFWSFYRHVARLAVTWPLEYPLRAEVLRGLVEVNQELAAELGPVPEWLEGATPIGTNPDGSTRFLTSRGANPFSALLQTPLSLLHPAWKIMYEQSSGRSAFTGREFSSPDVVTPFGSDQQFKIIRDDQGNVIDLQPIERVTPGIGEHLLQQIPQYDLLKDLAAGAATYSTADLGQILAGEGVIRDEFGQPLFPQGRLPDVAGFAGIPTTDFDLAEYQAELAQQERAALLQAMRRYVEV